MGLYNKYCHWHDSLGGKLIVIILELGKTSKAFVQKLTHHSKYQSVRVYFLKIEIANQGQSSPSVKCLEQDQRLCFEYRSRDMENR